jgi:hypothetical protein
LERERARELAEMQRLLKNRRNKAKSEKEIAVQQELKVLEQEKEVSLEDLMKKKKQIESLLEATISDE